MPAVFNLLLDVDLLDFKVLADRSRASLAVVEEGALQSECIGQAVGQIQGKNKHTPPGPGCGQTGCCGYSTFPDAALSGKE